MQRVRGIRANASRKSHAELDNSTELDAGHPRELGEQYAELLRRFPWINVLGGCCGTDHRHVECISASCREPFTKRRSCVGGKGAARAVPTLRNGGHASHCPPRRLRIVAVDAVETGRVAEDFACIRETRLAAERNPGRAHLGVVAGRHVMIDLRPLLVREEGPGGAIHAAEARR